MGKGKKHKKGKRLRLSEFFEKHFVPEWLQAKQLDPKTERSYRETLKHWVEITGDPPLKKIDGNSGMVAMFITELGKRKGKKSPTMARTSLGKHVTQAKTVVGYSGPDGLDFIERVPKFPMPKIEKTDAEKDWSVDEIRAMYDACDTMTVPVIDDISPADWWKCLLVVGYYCGLRITPLMTFEFGMIDGRLLRVAGAINKNKQAITKYLPAEALEHIERLRRPGRIRVLGWPGWPNTKSACYGPFKHLLKAAGIAPCRWWKYHSLRHTHINQLSLASVDQEQAKRTAQASAGHSNISITTDFYLSLTTKQRFAAMAIDQMRSPCGKAAAEREAAAAAS